MNKNNSNTVLFIGIAVAIGIAIGSFLNFEKKPPAFYSERSSENKIKKLINYIEYDYVDKVDTDSLLDGAIDEILKKLDPHSVYIPKERLQGIRESMEGNFKGIGIQFRMIRDSVTVLNVIKGGPSEKAGLLAGDRILFKDSDTIYGKSLSSKAIMTLLKGEDQEPVALTVYRKTKDSILKFNFKRGSVNLSSVPVYYMVNKTIGLIKLDRFARNTYDEFHSALLELKEQGMQTLILDLRGNTGGYMDIANSVVDEFLEDNKLIVFTKNKKHEVQKSWATEKGDFESGKIYVLIDEESASASEIVAGALQDQDKGTIVGRRSFGKGLVQQEMDLGDGSAIRLTTSRYYTPTGRSIQKPYSHNGSIDYDEDYKNRLLSGELEHKDSIHVVDSLRFTTPKGKVVYGGGGIIPDVFVARDSLLYYPQYHLTRVSDFVFDFIDNNRTEYTDMSWDDFISSYDEEAVFQAYKISIGNDGIHHNSNNSKFLKFYLKASMARELFGDTGFYRIWEERDNMIKKVINLEKEISNNE